MLATPPEVSMELAPALLQTGATVVDLSGAFRLRTGENYKRWYREEHVADNLHSQAVYGLPEFYRENVKGAKLVSNPGCYPTAANLAIAPLVRCKLIDRTAGIICDAKSGVSGAGRKPTLKTHFCEVTENFSAYSVLDHRHVPEVLMNSGLEENEFSFVAHLIPIDRGILETIYFPRRRRPHSRPHHRHLRERLRERAVHSHLRTRYRARHPRRPAHQLLRHRSEIRPRHAPGCCR